MKLRILKGRDYPGLFQWPQISSQVPYKREGESDWTHTEKEAIWRQGQRLEAGKDKEVFSSGASGGIVACWPLDFGLQASKTVRELRICCFKVPGFWWFVYSIPRRLIQYPIPNRLRAFLFISVEATTVSLLCSLPQVVRGFTWALTKKNAIHRHVSGGYYRI